MERRPDPTPLEVDDVALITALTGAWALAGVVLVVLRLAGSDVHDWWMTMCLAGFLLGLVGIRTCRRRKAALSSR